MNFNSHIMEQNLYKQLIPNIKLTPFSDILINGTKNGLYKSKEFHGHGTKIINMGELFGNSRLYDIEMKRVKLTGSEIDNFSVMEGDLLFARRSLTAEGAGKCSIVMEINEPTVFESSIIRARLDKKVANPLYLYYFFNSRYGIHLLRSIRRQVAVAGITSKDLQGLLLPLPALQEQNQIVEILNTLDKKIELNRQMNQTLESMARAIFKSWFVDFDPVYAKMESRDYPLPPEIMDLFPDELEESELGSIPKGWKVGKVQDLTKKIENGGTPKRDNLEYWENGTIPWLTSSEVRSKIIINTQNFITEKGLKNSSAKMWQSGTVIVALYGATAGEVCRTSMELCANQACCGLSPNKHVGNYLYISVSNSSKNLSGLARGSAQQNLSKDLVSNYSTIIPTDNLVKKFNDLTNPMFKKQENNLLENETLEKTRFQLLPRLLTGRINY